MNENNQKIMSELLSGEYGKAVLVGGKVYIIKAPTIRRIMRASAMFSDVGEIDSTLDVEARMSVIRGLSRLIAENERDEKSIIEALMDGTDEEIREAMEVALSLIVNKDFFVYAGVAREIARLSVSPAETR